jgi:hypothetical protein
MAALGKCPRAGLEDRESGRTPPGPLSRMVSQPVDAPPRPYGDRPVPEKSERKLTCSVHSYTMPPRGRSAPPGGTESLTIRDGMMDPLRVAGDEGAGAGRRPCNVL